MWFDDGFDDDDDDEDDFYDGVEVDGPDVCCLLCGDHGIDDEGRPCLECGGMGGDA